MLTVSESKVSSSIPSNILAAVWRRIPQNEPQIEAKQVLSSTLSNILAAVRRRIPQYWPQSKLLQSRQHTEAASAAGRIQGVSKHSFEHPTSRLTAHSARAAIEAKPNSPAHQGCKRDESNPRCRQALRRTSPQPSDDASRNMSRNRSETKTCPHTKAASGMGRIPRCR